MAGELADQRAKVRVLEAAIVAVKVERDESRDKVNELRGQVEHLKNLLVRDGITMTPEQLRSRARVIGSANPQVCSEDEL